MIVLFLADGFEEVEALTPLDMLRRGGLDIRTVGVGNKVVYGSHKIPVICDLCESEVKLETVDMVILPGGMPGSLNLDSSPFVDHAVRIVSEKGGRLAAICAAPLVLGRRGLLNGKKATCYPGFENELKGATVCDDYVVTDGNITTAKGMGTAFLFGKELLRLVIGKDRAEEIARGAIEPHYPAADSV